MAAQKRKKSRFADELRGKLRPHDPFEHIRRLKASQRMCSKGS